MIMKMKTKCLILFLALVALLVLTGCTALKDSSDTASDTANVTETDNSNKIMVYKSPTCGCCVKYVAYLERQGYDVEVITTNNMASIKEKYQITRQMESCHTTIIDDYAIEGHVPMSVVNKLLAERPDIGGISLPKMPAGSPGMPGVKKGPFVVYALNNSGAPTVYLED
jgi:hypothetical protein